MFCSWLAVNHINAYRPYETELRTLFYETAHSEVQRLGRSLVFLFVRGNASHVFDNSGGGLKLNAGKGSRKRLDGLAG